MDGCGAAPHPSDAALAAIPITCLESMKKTHSSPRLNGQDKAIFIRQLATMLRSGIPLFQALELIKANDKPALISKVAARLLADTQKGLTLAQAMARYPENFDHLLCSAVAAGEQGGNLDQILDRIAEQKEELNKLYAQLKTAAIWPLITLAVAVIVATIVLHGFHLLIIVAGAAAIFFGARYLLRHSPALATTMSQQAFSLPVFGKILHTADIIRWLTTLSILHRAGVPLDQTLQTTAKVVNNPVYKKTTEQMAVAVKKGSSLNAAIALQGVFPADVFQMVHTGEQAGTLDASTEQLAKLYQAKLGDSLARIMTFIPILMLLLVAAIAIYVIFSFYIGLFGQISGII